MSALAEADRDRLTRLLGMTGSAHDGEALNAARLADRLVRSAGLTWAAVLAPTLPPPDHDQHGDPGADPPHGDWRSLAAACARYPHLLTTWERQFIRGLPRFPRLSAKQGPILHRIVARLRASGCSL